MNPKYPIYIISKGRWQKRQTSKALEIMKVPYKIVVEPQEYKNYLEFIDNTNIEELIEEMFVWAMNQPNREVKKMEYEIHKNIYKFWL